MLSYAIIANDVEPYCIFNATIEQEVAMNSSTQSDWNEYYSKKKFDVPPFIVNALWGNYEAVLRKHITENKTDLVVMELGGADSCFYPLFRKSFNISEYHIVDNNQYGLDLFEHKQDKGVFMHQFDLLQGAPQDLGTQADIVFSAGLIEHFLPADTQTMVKSHFALTKPNGLVLMSFPTPTTIYWAFRFFLEKTGKFPPLFERPVSSDEILSITSNSGTTLENYKIWKTILTQLLVLFRKS